jgi:cyclopropane-fatty-acyl-phospholipid synthase
LDGDLNHHTECALGVFTGDKQEHLESNSPDPGDGSSIAVDAETDELHEAQLRKIDHILAKAKLEPGHRILEVGTGWGALAIRACRSVPGCTVDTLTLSTEQKELADVRIAAAGLTDRVRVHVMDYRSMPSEWKASFDRFISVEMMEHVGVEYMTEYFRCVDWALKPEGGVGIIQCITMPESRRNFVLHELRPLLTDAAGFDAYRYEVDFIKKWVSPQL